jgi:ElaA protein
MNDLRWRVSSFPDLTVRELHDLMRLRIDVFVVEQNCPYPEIDGQDVTALHILGQDEHDAVMAYARVLPPEQDVPHIGRVVVDPTFRGRGLARALMGKAIEVAHLHHGTPRSALAAQAYLETFYASLGYVRTSEEYLLDGIPHIDMVREG